jgi:hypothetical protein
VRARALLCRFQFRPAVRRTNRVFEEAIVSEGGPYQHQHLSHADRRRSRLGIDVIATIVSGNCEGIAFLDL